MRPLALILAAVLILGSAAAWAQPLETADPMERYKEETMRSKLGQALGVDQNTVERLIQIDRKYNPLKDQKGREAKAAYRQLQQMMSNSHTSDAEVRTVVDKVLKLPQEIQNLKLRQLEEQMTLLTPMQQARYLMFIMAMKNQMAQEARSMREAPKGARPPLQAPRELPVARPGQ